MSKENEDQITGAIEAMRNDFSGITGFISAEFVKISHLRWQPKKCILHRWILSSNIDYVFRGVWGGLVNNVQWN